MRLDSYELLSLFGLTRLEATIYTQLLSGESFTGYELAKLTGISRSNTYTALATLAEKGGAYIIEGTPIKYVAVPSDEFCRNRIRAQEDAAKKLKNLLPGETDSAEGYITINGREHIENKIFNMLQNASKRAYFAAGARTIADFEKVIRQMTAEGKKVVIITDSDMDFDKAQVFKTSDRGEQIRLIVDSKNVLTGDRQSCLYSGKENLVNVIKDSLKYELRLIKYGLDALED